MKNGRILADATFWPRRRFRSLLVLGLSAIFLAAQPAAVFASDDSSAVRVDPAAMARSVTIYRDRFGVPHIDGPTDESVIFGFAYCQAEDYLWQIEESYVAGLGRARELTGEEGYKGGWR